MRRKDHERGIEAAHQEQGKARVAVTEIELVVAILKGIVQRSIQFPGAKRTGAVQLLGFPFQASGVRIGDGPDGCGDGVHTGTIGCCRRPCRPRRRAGAAVPPLEYDRGT